LVNAIRDADGEAQRLPIGGTMVVNSLHLKGTQVLPHEWSLEHNAFNEELYPL
jgi:hypothetical protein